MNSHPVPTTAQLPTLVSHYCRVYKISVRMSVLKRVRHHLSTNSCDKRCQKFDLFCCDCCGLNRLNSLTAFARQQAVAWERHFVQAAVLGYLRMILNS